MTAVDTLTRAIERLEEIRDSLGLVYWTTDGMLLARADDDTDDYGARFMFGLDLTGIDTDEEVAEALVTLHRTTDAQLAILMAALGDAEGSHDEPGAFDNALVLATAIIGEVR